MRGGLILIIVVAVMISVCMATGCKAPECARMVDCCAVIANDKGVGKACGTLMERTSDPDTCRTVLITVRLMFEDRKKPVPALCKE